MDKEIQVFYDGSCPLCSKEISLYKNTQCTNPVKWVDVSSSETELDNQSREKLMSRFHIKDSDGKMLSGAKAFVYLWSNMRGWRYLAKVSNNPVFLPVAEFMYNKFLVVRPKIKSFIENYETDIPDHLVRDLRSDYAGEVGAVQIYRGILFATKDKDLIKFANHHLKTEQKHLEMISSYLPKYRRTLLKPFWIVAGFLTGFIPAIFSKDAVYKTIQTLETFVDQHYQEQINKIIGLNNPNFAKLLEDLKSAQADECAHRDEAKSWGSEGKISWLINFWCNLVSFGSKFAVKLARLI